MKRIELTGYLVFLDDAYRADTPGPDGKPDGRFRLAGRDRELRIIIEQVHPNAYATNRFVFQLAIN